MPQSLDQIIVQIVFSTKDRTPSLGEEILAPLHGYLASVVRNSGCRCFKVGGVGDHVHLAVGLSRTESAAGLVERLKTNSSRWLKTEAAGCKEFAWQRGYGVFSIGRSDLESLVTYVERQREHHLTKTFQEEYLDLLKEFGVEYDVRYIWD